ncbi:MULTISPECIES: hypothetical protein [unclassified Streptomyces]
MAEVRLTCLGEAYDAFTQVAVIGAPEAVVGGQQYELVPVQGA